MPRKKVNIDKITLEHFYQIERKSMNELTVIFNCHSCTITEYLKKYNIPPRPRCLKPKPIFCTKCSVEFRAPKNAWCKICTAQYKKEYAILNKEKLKNKRKEYYQNNREILIQRSKNHYKNNPEKKHNYDAKRRQKNIEFFKLKSKIYYENNKEACINRGKILTAKKYKTDPIFKLRNRVSCEIKRALHKNNSSKQGHSIIEFLPYTIRQLKEHLEYQFEPWMSWNNHGVWRVSKWIESDQLTWTWQIDHIIPQSDLPYTSMEDDNFQKCWALENLRPYSAKLNFLDGITRVRHGKK